MCIEQMNKKEKQMSPKQEADALREEAKKLLNELFCGILNIRVSSEGTVEDTVSISLQDVDKVVDCIISCAILETAIMQTKWENK
jgi:hypothetical protein